MKHILVRDYNCAICNKKVWIDDTNPKQPLLVCKCGTTPYKPTPENLTIFHIEVIK